MGATQIKEWVNHLKDGRTLADGNQSSRRPSTSQNANVIENVCSLILEDRHLTVQEIADEVGISTGSAHSILTEDLHMCVQSGGKIYAKAAFAGATTALP
jgi:AraC-like DNA-binding protein